MRLSKFGNSIVGEYHRAAAKLKERRRLTEDTKADLSSILRSAIHHYGEETRRLVSLPQGSPEKLKAQNALAAFSLAKERLNSASEKIVVEEILHSMSELDQTEYIAGIHEKLAALLDTIPTEEAEPVAAPAATAPEQPTGQPSPAPGGEAAEGDPGDIEFGVSEATGSDAPDAEDEISDDDFKNLVSQLA